MLSNFKLYDTLLQKVRLGNYHDGGYVVALQSIAKSSALVSYGIGNDISFENDYAYATGKNAYCFDHSIDADSIVNRDDATKDLIHIHKEGLSSFKTVDCNNFLQHYKELNLNGRVLFKADVEGHEAEYLLNTDISELNKITTGLIFEFHYLESPERRADLFKAMEKLNEFYYLCHAHGNNYSFNFVYDEEIPNTNKVKQYYIPNVIELAYVNKDLVKFEKRDKSVYPNNFLDRKNDLSRDECDLGFLNTV